MVHNSSVKQTGTLKKLSLILLFIVLLPALFYSAYEVNAISASEELIASMYRRQLDVILFSINQYAWDITNNWATTLNALLSENSHVSTDSLDRAFQKYLLRNSSVQQIVVTDTLLQNFNSHIRSQSSQPIGFSDTVILTNLRANKDKLERLLSFQRNEYRKLEPIQIGDSSNSLALVFVASDWNDRKMFVTMLLNEQAFIREALSAKLQEYAGEEFVLGIYREGEEQNVISTSELSPKQFKQNKSLWIFPDYLLGISLRGSSVEELTQSRFYRNLILIFLVDFILIVGVWFVYRNIRRELDLVRLKSDFVSNVSHELRTPLSLIRMYTETLEMDRVKSEEKKKEYYTTILQETERLTRLINTILDFSRMEAGKKQYTFTEIQLNDIVTNVLETYTSHFETEGIQPVVLMDDTIDTVHGDKEAIQEAIMNILDNAIKYGGKEKYLRISTGKRGDGIFVEIEDHGIGIAVEHHKKIFENFYRVSGALVHDVKGSGIGLSIVKHIMDAHQGKIHITSSPGKGSTFSLEFPVKNTTTH